MTAYVRMNALAQALDIAGSLTQNQAKTASDEPAGLGQMISGQTGSAASTASGAASGQLRYTGLTGMTAQSVGRFLTISNAATGANNGTWLIAVFNSSSSVDVVNASGVTPDANDGSIVWTERDPYSLEDDINFRRLWEQKIKGTTNWYDTMPTYQRPTAVGTNVDANLTNIAGKTLDAFARSVNRGKFNWPVEVTLTDLYGSSLYKHSDSVDLTGVPVFDTGPFASDWNSCFVEVTDATEGHELTVQAGLHIDEKIFGIAYNGASTSPNSVEVRWYSAPHGADISTSATAYSWEFGSATAKTGTTSVTVVAGANGAMALTGLTAGGFVTGDVGTWVTLSGLSNGANNGTFVIISQQSGTAITVQNHAAVSEGPTPTVTWTQKTKTQQTFVNLTYGYNERLDQLDQNAFRFPLVSGLVGNADLAQDIKDIERTIGTVDGETNLFNELTNTGNYFPFVNLSSPSTPTVVDALNTLNSQVGNRTYTGSALTILTNGQTITASLQALAAAIEAGTFTRIIERLASAVNAGTSHLLPASASYILDGTGNGKNLWVYWRGVLRDPGSVAGGNDYDETDTTHITPHSKINSGDHINYFIAQ